MSTSPPQTTLAAGLANLYSVIIPPRMRKDTPEIRLKIENSLVPSIAEHGIIHPPLFHSDGNFHTGVNLRGEEIESTFILIAGWSRMTACSLLGIPLIPYNLTTLEEHERLALELEENIRRNEMHWTDIVLGIRQVFLAKKVAADRHKAETGQVNGQTWGHRQMGVLINQSSGYVQEALLLAKLIRDGDKEILACNTATEARKIVSLRKEDQIAAELKRRHDLTLTKKSEAVVKTLKPVPNRFDMSVAPSFDLMAPAKTESDSDSVETVKVPISEMLFHGDSVFSQGEALSEQHSLFSLFPAETFDLIYTDIPFGIDMSNLQDLVNVDRIEEAHDVEENA